MKHFYFKLGKKRTINILAQVKIKLIQMDIS